MLIYKNTAEKRGVFCRMMNNAAHLTKSCGVPRESRPVYIKTKIALLLRRFLRGVPCWIRTNDLQLRRLLLYPAELRAQKTKSPNMTKTQMAPNTAGSGNIT